MKPAFFLILFFLLIARLNAGTAITELKIESDDAEPAVVTAPMSPVDSLYDTLKLEKAGLAKEPFYEAYKGYLYLRGRGQVRKKNILSIVDFSQGSHKKRLYIIDLVKRKLLYNTYVLHGKKSGTDMATSFSNKMESNKSSLGFLLTASTYTGQSGYSLKLRGMEPGINDNVLRRSIIVHGSDYINEQLARQKGRLANSLGCPAVPQSICKSIINAIKGGSVYFIYAPDKTYNTSSKILKAVMAADSVTTANANAAPDSSAVAKML